MTTHADRLSITLQLARYALSATQDLPAPVVNEARRAFLNYVGCALGGTDEPATRKALALADEFSGARYATVIGHGTRLDAQGAALVNCLASSIHTFDDTHLQSVTHPTGPVAAAMMALLEHRAGQGAELGVSGADFLAALALGVEISCRVAAALTMTPAKPELGLFTTGLTGGIGAAAACGRLLQLNEEQTVWALGIAAAQGCGFRATHATMSGGLVPALGARSGLYSALLAASDFDCSAQALEGINGFFEVFAPGADASVAVRDMGRHFEILQLSYKPYPCGVVIHPAIDACLDMVAEIDGRSIESVSLQVNPLALQLTGNRHPASGFGTKNSLFHWVACALLRGRAGLQEATDDAVHEPAIVAMRGRIIASADDTLARDAIRMELRLDDGSILRADVPHARGGRERPLSDVDLGTKFTGMASARLPAMQSAELLALCETLPSLKTGWLPALAACSRP